MASSTTTLLLLLLSLLSAAAADTAFIQKTCQSTKHYDLCVSSLNSDPASQSSDTKGLALIMIDVGVANSTATSAYLKAGSEHTAAVQANDAMLKVLKECADKYGYAADALQSAAQDLAAQSLVDYAYVHVTAAADYPSSCHNAFSRYRGLAYPSELARREEGLKRICDVVLGIIGKISW